MKFISSVLTALIASTTALSVEPPTPIFLEEKELYCLTEAIYHESRGESAVCQVILVQSIFNRMAKRWYPNNACKVINQPSQYSYKTEIKDHIMYDEDSKARAIQHLVYAINMPFDLSMGATHFIRHDAWAYWKDHPKVTYLGQCDNHVYFREDR